MHSSFGRVDALFVIAMKDQPLLRDLKMQFPKAATPQAKVAEILCGPMPAPQASAYRASKAAVDAITISLSQELGSRKIRVNSLNPGMVETDGLRASGMDHGAFREQIGRIPQPEDIALAATFLASDDSRWITGQVIVAAGGRRM
jgi:3-oxoacyl-[acyl-carrier protein] reductase